jgi:hypothetical protein
MNKKDNKNFKWGALFGVIAPFFGLFVGLQIIPFFGTILLFPFVLISKIVGQPLGEFSTTLLVLSFILSIIVWGGIFVLIGQLIRVNS